MPNQQLVGYIKQQLQNNVGKEAITAALLGAGWSQVDVSEAMQLATGSTPAPAPVAPPGPAPSASVFSANEVIFQPETVSPPVVVAGAPAVAGPMAATVIPTSAPAGHVSRRWFLSAIVLGVMAAVFAGISAFLYFGNSDSGTRLATLSRDNGKLSNQLSELTASKKDMDTRFVKQAADVDDLSNQLAVFASPTGSSPTSTEELAVKLRGILGISSGGDFFLTSSRNVIFPIKGFRDAKTQEDAKPLVSTLVDITGTHLSGSKLVTVTSIKTANQPSLQVKAKSEETGRVGSTSTPQTAPKATSTVPITATSSPKATTTPVVPAAQTPKSTTTLPTVTPATTTHPTVPATTPATTSTATSTP
ncbi:MAG: hypothetical protein HY978_00970 [Candidatus Liptonbacteria bacterium]|nr:hypothetical protein [Candidatus Liptonbacteria bacterium]